MSSLAKCIAFFNKKGGSGKTTTCLSIAGWLAKKGKKVLVVDFDSQANATSGLGVDAMSSRYTMYDAVLAYCDGKRGVPITQVILKTEIENIHLAPSELDMSAAEVIMQDAENRTGILNRILADVRPLYDYILLDLPSSLGLLSINGLCASDQVVVPLEPSIYALEALDNIKVIFRDIRRKTRHVIDQIVVVLIRYVKSDDIFTKMFGRRSPSQEVEARLRDIFDTVFIVPDSDEIYQAQKAGLPISHFAPGSRAGKAYAAIVNSIIDGDTAVNKKIKV